MHVSHRTLRPYTKAGKLNNLSLSRQGTQFFRQIHSTSKVQYHLTSSRIITFDLSWGLMFEILSTRKMWHSCSFFTTSLQLLASSCSFCSIVSLDLRDNLYSFNYFANNSFSSPTLFSSSFASWVLLTIIAGVSTCLSTLLLYFVVLSYWSLL